MPRSRPGLMPGGRGVARPRLGPDETMVDVHLPAASVKLPRPFSRSLQLVCSYQPCRTSRKPASLPAGSTLGVLCQHDSDICFASVRTHQYLMSTLHFIKPCMFDSKSLYTPICTFKLQHLNEVPSRTLSPDDGHHIFK